MENIFTENYGIEDFQMGLTSSNSSSRVKKSDFDRINSLGLLGALKEHKTAEEFGSEAYNILGEANQIHDVAESNLLQIATTIKTAKQVSSHFGAEDFDTFAFGAEDFTDKLKSGFKAVVATIKKLVQVVSNFLAHVKAFIGGKLAKHQESVCEKYATDGGKKSAIKPGALVKFAMPANLTDPTDCFKTLTDKVIEVGKELKYASDRILDANLTSRNYIGAIDIARKSYVYDDKTEKGGIKDPFNSIAELTIDAKKSKKLKIAKLGSSKRLANAMVYGTPDVKKVSYSVVKIFTDIVDKANIRDAWIGEDSTKKLVKAEVTARETLKCLNSSIKQYESLLKSTVITEKITKDSRQELRDNKANIKKNNKEIKKNIKTLRDLTLCNRVYSLLVGAELGAFNEILHIRSIITKVAKMAMKEEKEYDEDSNAYTRQQARKTYYGA